MYSKYLQTDLLDNIEYWFVKKVDEEAVTEE